MYTISLGPEGLRRLWKLLVASPIASFAGRKLSELCGPSLFPKNNSDSSSLALVSLIPYMRSPRVGIWAGDLNVNGLPMRGSFQLVNGHTNLWSRGQGREGTHRSWNLSTQTGSLPAPRGTWGQRHAGTSPRAAGTASRRTCTWAGAGRAASGSRCCFGGSQSGTCGQEERASADGAAQSLHLASTHPSSLCSGQPRGHVKSGTIELLIPRPPFKQQTHQDH